MDALKRLWELAQGKKTYLAAAGLLLYGLLQGDNEAVLIALGLLGLRHGVRTEVNRLRPEV